MRQTHFHTAALLTLLLVMVSSPASARLYKWVDEDGNIHYSDKIPPDQARKRHQVLDERGLVRENVRRAKTPEEIEEERRLRQLQVERERAERQQAIRDQVLLETFPSERDLVIARDDRLASIDSAISLATKTLTELQTRFDTVDAEIKSLQATRQPVPGNLAIEHKRLRDQIRSHSQALASRHEERDNIVAQFESDLVRYRELRALRQ